MTVAAYFNRRGFVHDKKAPSSGSVVSATRPATTPLGGPSIYAAWWGQCLCRLARPVFTPLDRASIYAAWQGPCLHRLTRPAFTSLGGPSVYAAWWGQCLRRLARLGFTPLGSQLWIFCDTQSDRSCRFSAAAIRSGKRSGVQAKTGTPRPARKAAWLLS